MKSQFASEQKSKDGRGGEAFSSHLGLPSISLTQVIIDPGLVQIIPEELAKRHTLIPFALRGGLLYVAIADPSNVRALEDVRITTGFEIKAFLADSQEIRAAIRQYLTMEKTIAALSSSPDQVHDGFGVWSVDDSDIEGEKDSPLVRLVDSLLHQAIAQGASDIHWEYREQDFIVRYRIDGQLELKRSLPLSAARSVASRLKIMAGMDVAERRLPQDGRMAIDLGGRQTDLRVSSIPTVYGEKLVVRILDSLAAERSLNRLGMRAEIEGQARFLMQQSHGLILVVGPTGSGKTTTLYSLLRELKSQSLNIVSIEDPVEYRLPGVNQVPVNAKMGLTFASGLRSILRQDPDVIMIGEIRDEETARIAMAAALTGHLVLSTLHTNTAAEALTRLLDMGIEPYLLAATISGVLSQRLVRVICEHCKTDYELSPAERVALNLPPEIEQLYEGKGCTRCRGTGYAGRIGIHELLLYNQTIKELILSRHSSHVIELAAIESGMVPLWQDGLMKVTQGMTTIREVLRSTSAVAL